MPKIFVTLYSSDYKALAYRQSEYTNHLVEDFKRAHGRIDEKPDQTLSRQKMGRVKKRIFYFSPRYCSRVSEHLPRSMENVLEFAFALQINLYSKSLCLSMNEF